MEECLKHIITICVACIGWVAVHHFTARRDRLNKKREISLQHLISTYQILTYDISNRPPSKDKDDKLEKVISDIQLFGTIKQIELIKRILDELVDNKVYQLDLLINELRNDLREELGLERVRGNVYWLRS